MRIPLITVCIRIGPMADTEAYASAYQAAFREAEVPGFGPVGAVPLLEVTEVRHFHCDSRQDGRDLLDSRTFGELKNHCERLLVVVIDASPISPEEDPPVLTVEPGADDAPAYIQLVTLFLSPRSLFAESTSADGRTNMVRLGLNDLDERDLQIPFFVLHLLRTATALLTKSENSPGKTRFFFSHAKRDGVPLARGTQMWMKRLPGFRDFYDTDDLDLAGDWRGELSKAVADSILVVFRTEIFDQRYWCRQEVLWADEHHRPFICVDARWHLQQESSLIGFDSSPAVRVPDGSILRILMAALREACRVALFQRRVALATGSNHAGIKAIPRAPSLVNLASARRELDRAVAADPSGQEIVQYIVYPNPAVPEEVRRSLESLIEVRSDKRQLRVRAFDEWRAETAFLP